MSRIRRNFGNLQWKRAWKVVNNFHALFSSSSVRLNLISKIVYYIAFVLYIVSFFCNTYIICHLNSSINVVESNPRSVAAGFLCSHTEIRLYDAYGASTNPRILHATITQSSLTYSGAAERSSITYRCPYRPSCRST